MDDQPKINKLTLEQFGDSQRAEKELELKQLNDVTLRLRVELGHAKVPLKEILAWKRDTIITLDKLAGENVDVYIHSVRFGSGEVLVVEDNFAVRLTELLSYLERVKLGLGRATE